MEPRLIIPQVKATRKGRELMSKLHIARPGILGICSLICRHATAYARIQEQWCCDSRINDAYYASRLETKEAQLEKRIEELASLIPEVKSVHFQGDPRGATVKLVMHDPTLHDCWGRVGVCVPGA